MIILFNIFYLILSFSVVISSKYYMKSVEIIEIIFFSWIRIVKIVGIDENQY